MADNARLQTSSPAGGSAVGRELHEAREALGITIPQMADTLRIRAAHIAALEEGRFADLPGRPYAFGFARSIARHLGLDPEVIAARLRDEVMGASAPVELVFPESTEDKRLSRTGWVAISLVAVAVAYGAWIAIGSRSDNPPAEFSSYTPPSQQVPEVIVESPDAEPSAPPPDDIAAPPAPAPQTSTPRAAAPAPRAPSATAPAGTSGSSTARPAAPSAGNRPGPTAGYNLTPRAESQEEVDVTPEPSNVAGATPAGRIVIRARQEAWVQVQSSSGSTVFAKLLRAGDSYAVPDQRGLKLTTGNAGGIDVIVDGRLTPSLGQVGAVRRDFALDANRLRSDLE